MCLHSGVDVHQDLMEGRAPHGTVDLYAVWMITVSCRLASLTDSGGLVALLASASSVWTQKLAQSVFEQAHRATSARLAVPRRWWMVMQIGRLSEPVSSHTCHSARLASDL